ncbi:MAG: DUF1846 domain-containing protein [Erysipelotrichaceae bacterium]|nr:DUF1846 domain-containing protein [Erysipelotrichaceae bacterium]
MNKIAFNNDKYMSMQTEKIKERIGQFDNKLYLEFGGKLFDDFHASRVLPGFQPDTKIRMLMQMKDKAEIIVVINASDIEKNKIRADLGITYDQDVLRLIDAFRACDLYVSTVVIARYEHQAKADSFKAKVEALGIKVAFHYSIAGYPNNIEHIVSEEGLGKNEWVKTTRELIVVTAPGPGSGKLATCLSQLYHDHKNGIKAGYAKFETFPIWNIPLKHSINLAYEAATADLNDVNMIDPFHLETYNKMAVNYNRDVEAFPLLNELFKRIMGKSIYHSPTDMGVNMAGYCIEDDEAAREASNEEILRRYYTALTDLRKDRGSQNEIDKIELIMQQAGITKNSRRCVAPALEKAEETGEPACAMELNDGTIITGKTSSLLGASSSCLINAMKYVAHIDDDVLLIAPNVIEPIQSLKVDHLKGHNPRLHTDEVLIAIAITAVMNPNAKKAMDSLSLLEGAEMHSSVIVSEVDAKTLKKLGIHLTCEPQYQPKKLVHLK